MVGTLFDLYEKDGELEGGEGGGREQEVKEVEGKRKWKRVWQCRENVDWARCRERMR
jgi:hypothetical protein